MPQQSKSRVRLGRYKQAILLGAALALLAAALLAFWLTRPAASPPICGVVQIAQVDDLRVTFQIDNHTDLAFVHAS